MSIPRYFFKESKRIVLSTHALKRAFQRGITAEMIKESITSGKCKSFGKNHLKFCKRSRKGSVICIGVEANNIIVIKTVEWKRI